MEVGQGQNRGCSAKEKKITINKHNGTQNGKELLNICIRLGMHISTLVIP
jgi:hypothetical protein